MTQQLQTLIDNAWDNRASLSPAAAPKEIVDAVDHVISELNNGTLRVATREAVGQWTVHQWIKKAVLLSFRLKDNELIEAGDLGFYDKVPTKFGGLSADEMSATGVRVVPPAVARRGSFIAKGAILMPSYVNIGAYVDEGTMVDTWATVGSCAQVGKHVHLSGGVGIGGVLEPVQAAPVIIEDGAFIGSRAIVVEGVRVGREAVLGANVVLTASTRIIDVTGPGPKEMKGHVPPRSVVIPGTVPKHFPAGEYGVPCALIIGQRKESTDRKTSLNEVLREHNVAV
jgi:2,3,4,5-tetrahydropyridine-2-carboxylate N-succinyltransferase